MNKFLYLRKNKGLSQIELAKAMNIHQTAISQWETGKTNPDMETLKALADFFEVTTDYLLGRTDNTTLKNKKKPTAESDELSEREKVMLELFRKAPIELQELTLIALENRQNRREEKK